MKINLKSIPYEFYDYYLFYFYFKNDYSFYEYLKKDKKYINFNYFYDLYEKNILQVNNSFLSFFLVKEKSFFINFKKPIVLIKTGYVSLMDSVAFEEIVRKIGDNIIDIKGFYDSYSCLLAKYFPHLIDYKEYDWEFKAHCYFKYASKYFDPDKYDWEKYSLHIVKYGTKFFDPERFNWNDKKALFCIFHYVPILYQEEKRGFDWKKGSYAFIEYYANAFQGDKVIKKYKDKINWSDPRIQELIKNHKHYSFLKKYI